MNLNKAIIVGRLTQDPEKRNIPDSGLSVTSFGMATNTYFKDKSGENQERAEFHNIVLFGNVADVAARFLSKGSLALIEGRIQTRSWDDKEGNKKYRTEVVGERLQLGPRSEGQTQRKGNEDKEEKKIPVINEDDEIDVEDIPF